MLFARKRRKGDKQSGTDENMKAETVYDITKISDKAKWQYYFSKTFPETIITIVYVDGRCFSLPIEKARRDYALYHSSMYMDLKDGISRLMMGKSFKEEDRKKISDEVLRGKEGLAISVWGEPDKEGKAPVHFESRAFSELGIVEAREFTEEEKRLIDNAEIRKKIDEKEEELTKLKAQLKPIERI